MFDIGLDIILQKMKFKHILILFISINFANSKVTIQRINDSHNMSELTNKTKLIINELLKTPLYLIVINSDDILEFVTRTELFRYLHSDRHVPVISLHDYLVDDDEVFVALKRNDNIDNSVGFIFIINETKEECFVNSNWTYSPFWNPRAFFLLVITKTVTEETDRMADMFRDCWENFNILNLVVIFQYEDSFGIDYFNRYCKETTKLKILTYNPFVNSNNIVNINSDYLNKLRPLLPNKLSDVQGYNIITVTRSMTTFMKFNDHKEDLIAEGRDVDIFNLVIKKINATLIYTPPKESDSKFNPSKQIVLNMEPIQPYNLERTSYPHVGACITVITPKASEIPRYMNIVLPFTNDVWRLYLFTVFCVTGVWSLISHLDIIEGNEEISKDKLVESLSIIILGSTQCKPSFLPQRLIITFILFLNLIFNNSYQGCLTSYLATTKYYPDFKTLNEALYSDLKVSTFFSISEMETFQSIVDIKDPFFTTLVEKLVLIPNEDEALYMMSHHKNICRLTFKLYGLSIVNQPKYYKDDSPLLHVVDDCYASHYAGIDLGDRNSPFIAMFSTTLQRMVEGGVIEKMNNDFISRGVSSSSITKGFVGPKVLILEHLQTPFYILIIGLCLSGVVFVTEAVLFHFVVKKLLFVIFFNI